MKNGVGVYKTDGKNSSKKKNLEYKGATHMSDIGSAVSARNSSGAAQ